MPGATYTKQERERDFRARIFSELAVRKEIAFEEARKNPAAFAGVVLRDERTRALVKLAPIHVVWHDLATKHNRLVIWAHVESGKSTQIAIARTLWEIGRDPSLRTLILSNTHGQAVKIVRTIGQYATQSEEVKRVFKKLRPRQTGWKPDSGSLTFERPTFSKDPTIQATGVHGNVLGSRLDLVIVDDILDFENTLRPAGRDGLWDWFQATIMGRLTANARVVVIGTAHHPDDLMHRFAKHPGWKAVRYPALDDAGEPRWPERWPKHRIEEARGAMAPVEFARQLMCVARDDTTSKFKREWIEVALKRGQGKRLAHALSDLPDGLKTYTGVDLAVQQHAAADLTSLFTIAVHPDGSREVLCIESGRWSGPDIVRRIFETHMRFRSIVIVENNGAQDFVLQFASSQYALPIKAFTTGRNKAHPEFGVEGIAAEMEQGKWIIPNEGGKTHPEVQAWIDEMLFYDPRSHTGDRLMACVAPGHLVTTARGLVPIEEVQEGDQVLTHKSRWRRVTGTTQRPYAGEAIQLKPRGMRSLVVTPEHPVWSAQAWFERAQRTNRLIPKDWGFRDAQELRVGRKAAGDFVLAPAAPWPASPPEVDPQLAFLAGLYLAEGWTSDHQASFAFNRREDYLVELVRREAQRLWAANTSAYTKEGHGGVTACIQSTKATRFFERFGKRENKALPWEWMALPVELGLLVVRGWLVGDGSVSRSAKGVRHLRGVSVSRALIYQMQEFLWRAGLLPSVCPFAQPLTFRGRPCGHLPAQSLSISEADTARLLTEPLPEEVARWGSGWRAARERTNSASVPIEGGVAVKLAAADRFQYDGVVHNLHVEEDESFVVEGIAVHNSWFAREGYRLSIPPVAEIGTLDLLSR